MFLTKLPITFWHLALFCVLSFVSDQWQKYFFQSFHVLGNLALTVLPEGSHIPEKNTKIEILTANDYNQGTNVCTEEADKPQTIYTTLYQSL